MPASIRFNRSDGLYPHKILKPQYVHWNRVTEHRKDLNHLQKVTVHTISYSNSKWYCDQLEKIAEAPGGEFRYYE
jgi:hypothetical protein